MSTNHLGPRRSPVGPAPPSPAVLVRILGRERVLGPGGGGLGPAPARRPSPGDDVAGVNLVPAQSLDDFELFIGIVAPLGPPLALRLAASAGPRCHGRLGLALFLGGAAVFVRAAIRAAIRAVRLGRGVIVVARRATVGAVRGVTALGWVGGQEGQVAAEAGTPSTGMGSGSGSGRGSYLGSGSGSGCGSSCGTSPGSNTASNRRTAAEAAARAEVEARHRQRHRRRQRSRHRTRRRH